MLLLSHHSSQAREKVREGQLLVHFSDSKNDREKNKVFNMIFTCLSCSLDFFTSKEILTYRKTNSILS